MSQRPSLLAYVPGFTICLVQRDTGSGSMSRLNRVPFKSLRLVLGVCGGGWARASGGDSACFDGTAVCCASRQGLRVPLPQLPE